jgi:2-C-methyl-D-erythritol 2,4-cyclodiphosphate synthase
MIRIGFSKDVHHFVEGEPFILGGIEIDHHSGPKGHSDGDCLLHAIAESLLGALALGDLGKFFPDTEEKYRNYDSQLILGEVFEYIYKKGYEISNLDCMISLEQPRLRPYVKGMRNNIARILKCDKSQVSIKCTTHEGLGFVGREEGILCEAIVLLDRTEFLVE